MSSKTPVYIQAGYAWRAGARGLGHLDPNAVGHEIAALRDRDGVIAAPAVVERAQQHHSAMHSYFDWDNNVAGPKWREEQARYLLRQVVTVVADPVTEDEIPTEDRAFVALYTEDQERPRQYQMPTARTVMVRPTPDAPPAPVLVVTSPPAVTASPERARATETLRKWAASYQDDPYFAGVVAAIRALP